MKLNMYKQSILKSLLKILFRDRTHCIAIFVLFNASLVTDIGIGVHYKELYKLISTLSAMWLPQMQHFFFIVNLRYAFLASTKLY